jgi:hypothetical protein
MDYISADVLHQDCNKDVLLTPVTNATSQYPFCPLNDGVFGSDLSFFSTSSQDSIPPYYHYRLPKRWNGPLRHPSSLPTQPSPTSFPIIRKTSPLQALTLTSLLSLHPSTLAALHSHLLKYWPGHTLPSAQIPPAKTRPSSKPNSTGRSSRAKQPLRFTRVPHLTPPQAPTPQTYPRQTPLTKATILVLRPTPKSASPGVALKTVPLSAPSVPARRRLSRSPRRALKSLRSSTNGSRMTTSTFAVLSKICRV